MRQPLPSFGHSVVCATLVVDSWSVALHSLALVGLLACVIGAFRLKPPPEARMWDMTPLFRCAVPAWALLQSSLSTLFLRAFGWTLLNTFLAHGAVLILLYAGVCAAVRWHDYAPERALKQRAEAELALRLLRWRIVEQSRGPELHLELEGDSRVRLDMVVAGITVREAPRRENLLLLEKSTELSDVTLARGPAKKSARRLLIKQSLRRLSNGAPTWHAFSFRFKNYSFEYSTEGFGHPLGWHHQDSHRMLRLLPPPSLEEWDQPR